MWVLLVLNANLRRIDLCCKLLSPALTGVILQRAGPFSTTVIVAAWNIISFFGELGLLWVVYKQIPTLAIKKVRNPKNPKKAGVDERQGVDENRDDEVCYKVRGVTPLHLL